MKRLAESDSHAVTERYSAILQTAERLFGEKGYHRLSIDEIAKEAGVSKGLIFYHFTSKKVLVERILEDAMTAVFIKWDAIAQSGESGRAKLRAAVAASLDIFSSRPYLARIALFGGSGELEMKDTLINMRDKAILRMDALLSDGFATGEFRAVDTRTAATLILAMVTGLPLQAAFQPHVIQPVNQIADEIADIVCDGICQ
jgi:AcrR family transcriptional regulator